MRAPSVVLLFISLCGRSLAAQHSAPEAHVSEIAIERRLADAAHLRVGDSVRLGSPGARVTSPARIGAIYEPKADPAVIMRREFHVRLHLPDLVALTGDPDRVDRIGISLRPGANADSAAVELNRNAFGYTIYPTRQIATQSSATFLVVSRFHRAIAIISVLASSIFLLCLMLMKVEERRRDVAVLRFTGISHRTVFLSLVLESVVIAVVGSIAGTLIATAASAVVNGYYRRYFQTALIFSELKLNTVLIAVGLSLVLGIVAGAVAAWRLVRISPIQLWSRAA